MTEATMKRMAGIRLVAPGHGKTKRRWEQLKKDIASWPAWERDAARALLAKEMTPGAFIETGGKK